MYTPEHQTKLNYRKCVMSNTLKLFVALILAFGVGIIASLTKNLILLNMARWIEPVGAIWIGLLRMTILPLVIALLVTAITGMSKNNSLGSLMKKTAIVFLALNLLMIVITLLVVPPLLKLIPASLTVSVHTKTAATVISNEPLSFVNELLGWIPVNPFKSAAEGAIMPIIIFSIFLGLAVNRIANGPKNIIVQFFQGLSDAMLVIVRWLFIVAPIGIFAVVFPLICQMGTGIVGALVYYVIITILNFMICMLMLYACIYFFSGQSIRRFASASLQPQVVVIGTQSSVATLPAMITAADHGLQISPQITSPVLTLAVSVFRAGSLASLIIYALFTAHIYHINFTLSQMTTVVLISILANIASIGIPSAASFFAPITTLFQAIGLPFEMIAILFAVDTIPDVAGGVVNVTGDMTAVAIVAEYTEVIPDPGEENGDPV